VVLGSAGGHYGAHGHVDHDDRMAEPPVENVSRCGPRLQPAPRLQRRVLALRRGGLRHSAAQQAPEYPRRADAAQTFWRAAGVRLEPTLGLPTDPDRHHGDSWGELRPGVDNRALSNVVAVPLSGPILNLSLLGFVLWNITPALAYPLNASRGFPLVALLVWTA